jgi:hypothetical protein
MHGAKFTDDDFRYLSGILIETGSETTTSYLQSLVLALVAHPEAQKKAHEEIDRVVGEHRMPTLNDLENMPYIRALILEVSRQTFILPPFNGKPFRLDSSIPAGCTSSHTPLCTGFGAGMSTILYQDGLLSVAKYKGQLIPKGATIFINACELMKFITAFPAHRNFTGGIFHDPGKLVPPSFGLPTDPQISDLYDDPETFIPDRYLLSENGTKPGVDGTDLRPNFPFGAGRVSTSNFHFII